jgi:DNA-directed RNA polymerase specialized sigma24 family protein
VSLSPQQRAQILYLYRVEGVSIVFLAAMTELSRAAVTEVVQRARRQGASAASRAAAMLPSSKGRIEQPFHRLRVELLRKVAS